MITPIPDLEKLERLHRALFHAPPTELLNLDIPTMPDRTPAEQAWYRAGYMGALIDIKEMFLNKDQLPSVKATKGKP